MGAEQQTELNDVVLCYQSLGIPLTASTASIEKRYRTLSDEYKKKAASADPAVREEAKQSLELLVEIYGKIRSSITYKAMESEEQKKAPAQAQAAPARRVHDAIAQRGLMTPCPRCNGMMVKGAKVCPVCKATIETPMEKVASFFTVKKVIVYCIIVLAGLIVVGLVTGQH